MTKERHRLVFGDPKDGQTRSGVVVHRTFSLASREMFSLRGPSISVWCGPNYWMFRTMTWKPTAETCRTYTRTGRGGCPWVCCHCRVGKHIEVVLLKESWENCFVVPLRAGFFCDKSDKQDGLSHRPLLASWLTLTFFYSPRTIALAHGCLSRCVPLVTVHHCVGMSKQMRVFESVVPCFIRCGRHLLMQPTFPLVRRWVVVSLEAGTFVHDAGGQAKL